MNKRSSSCKSHFDFSLLPETASPAMPAIPPMAAIPFLIRRSALFAICPSLNAMLNLAKQDCRATGENTDLIAALAPYEDFGALLPANKFDTSTVLVFFLPDHFEPFLLDTVSQQPKFCGHFTTDLQNLCVYFQWEVGTEHKVLLPESILLRHLFYNFVYAHGESDCSNHVHAPFVFVAGSSAAIGGITVNNDLMDDAQCASYGASNYVPSLQFDTADLARAALESERIGMTPWAGDWHQVETGCKVRRPWIQDFTRHQFENASLLRGLARSPESQDI